MTYRTKVFWLLIATAILASGASTIVADLGFSRLLFNQVRSKLLSVAATAGALIDGDAHQQLRDRSGEDTETYRNLRQGLARAIAANQRKDFHLEALYTYMNAPGDRFQYGVDPDNDFELHRHVGDAYLAIASRVPVGATTAENYIVRDHRDRTWMLAWAPIRNQAGQPVAEIELVAPASNFVKVRSAALWGSARGFACAIAVALLVALIVAPQISRPLDTMNTAFSGFIPAPLRQAILEGRPPAIKGERRRITIMFLDIRDFTAASEAYEPEVVVAYLAEFHEVMVDAIVRNRGMVDKFLGDGIMAIFGAPDDDQYQEQHAVNAALEMRAEAAKLNARHMDVNLPPGRIGIGINSGPAIVGIIGSARRFEYSAIGTAVNVAARLEGATKEHAVDVLISAATYEAVRPSFRFTKVGEIHVKGVTDAITTYTVEGKIESATV